MRATKAIIYRENLKHNLMEIRKKVGLKTEICLAVKADAYGHGAVETAKVAHEIGGINFFAVATVDEGMELRQAGIRENILLLSLAIPEEFENIFAFNLIPFVFGKEYIELLAKSAASYFKEGESQEVFLAVDTGMGRIGCYPDQAGEEAGLICSSKYLSLKGMSTHFCQSDGISQDSQEFTREQYHEFLKAVEDVKERGINPGICSCGNSAAIMKNPEMHFDMVRPGIIAYGYYPGEVTGEYLQSINMDFDLKPVMALESQVVAIRHCQKGKSISYGRTYYCPQDTDIAILPIGYGDGLLRRFSPGMEVTINGKKYPVCGRICMDQCMVDIGKDNPNVKVFDRAIIFGPKESGALTTADDLAKIGNTISYEVLTSVSRRVKRIFTH
ncbi:MAG: alanine racemase [Treponema sp.]|nr:alanine racemase [Treponema sp.]